MKQATVVSREASLSVSIFLFPPLLPSRTSEHYRDSDDDSEDGNYGDNDGDGEGADEKSEK